MVNIIQSKRVTIMKKLKENEEEIRSRVNGTGKRTGIII